MHQAIEQKMTKESSWMVVLTILKNISQWEGLSHILWKIKNVPNHQPASHQGLQVTETNRHSLASTHGAIMNSMNPICEKALSSQTMCQGQQDGKCHKCPSVAILS
jgi:hypothetical protein